MSTLFTSQSDENLQVHFNGNSGEGTIAGTSIGLNSTNALHNLASILKEYAKNPAKETSLTVGLCYFNTRSASKIWEIFKVLEELNLSEKSKASVIWHSQSDDKDLIETGEVYQSLCPSLPIHTKIIAPI
ncbi:SiaC family regulatory phosphoprotein [Flavobacteriales bacterium]|jgi:hypothetical protein|nr:SiaC family regulatory phosphoprotein [Flavobacteriales bacterium]